MEKDEEILKILIEQENKLIFNEISAGILKDIGFAISAKMKAYGKMGYVTIFINGQELYSEAINGATPDNRAWAKRKGNTVNLLWKSSLRVKKQLLLNNRSFEERGLPVSEYAISGGAFPIKISNDITIGYIAVSGMTDKEDHQIIVDTISSFLNIDTPAIVSII